MGKFSSGMKKYGNYLQAAFVLDKKERKRLKRENKLNHAELLAITPFAPIVSPVFLITGGIGAISSGVFSVALGLLIIPTALIARILIGKGLGLMQEGKGLVVGGGLLVSMGGAVTVAGVISPVYHIVSSPYNGYKAFKHRARNSLDSNTIDNESDMAISAPLPQYNTRVDESSTFIMNQLGGEIQVNSTHSVDLKQHSSQINITPQQQLSKPFECPITLALMKEPVMCTLDGHSYEKSEITKWLVKHRYSPMTRVAMNSKQTVEEVLIPNRALAYAIEGYRAEHPELSAENDPSVPLSI